MASLPLPPRGDSEGEHTESLDVGELHLLDERADPTAPSLARGTDLPAEEETRIGTARRARPAAPATSTPPAALVPSRTRPRSASIDERVGELVGSYRLLEVIGEGGMGYVYRAEHVRLGREVAIKFLRRDYAQRRDAIARFFQEARTVARIRHRNIVDIVDFVEQDDGVAYIVMELLTGVGLTEWARPGVPLARALDVIAQICEGLGAAHAVGVVHRDLKPDNILVVADGDGGEVVKLLDFGVAKMVSGSAEPVALQTAIGAVIGTPGYMSPEQAGGAPVDGRADLYALGAILYELFCGEPMFRGQAFGDFVRKHLTEQPVPPRATVRGAGLDPRIEALILRCVEKDPDARFPSALAMRDAVRAIAAAPLPITETTAVPPAASAATGWAASGLASPAPTTSTSGVRPRPPGPGPAPAPTPWWVWLVVCGSAAAVGIAAAAYLAMR
ncbi:MAG: serine/threonine-protein kinase [Kofleriaceae bacterium]